MPDPHPRKHSLVVQLAEDLHDSMKGAGTEEIDTWRALYLAQHYNIMSWVEHEFYTNWSNKSDGSLRSWILDDFSGEEERFTEFLRKADQDTSSGIYVSDGIPKYTSYNDALPVKHIKDEKKMVLPGGNEEVLVVGWEFDPWLPVTKEDISADRSYEGKKWRKHEAKSRSFIAIDHRTRWRYDIVDPVDKSTYQEHITTKELFNILPNVKLGRENRNEDWWTIKFKKQSNTYNGKPIYSSIEGSWTIKWSNLPSERVKVRNRAGEISEVKLPELNGWVLHDSHWTNALNDGKNKTEKENGDRILQLARKRSPKVKPTRWISLEGDSEPTGMSLYDRRKWNGSIKIPGGVTKVVWTVEDTKLMFGNGKSFSEHYTVMRHAYNCWCHIYNNDPEALYNTIIEVYSMCKRYPTIIERFHYCFYYFNPFERYTSMDDDKLGSGTFNGGDKFGTQKLFGERSRSYLFGLIGGAYFSASRSSLRAAIHSKISDLQETGDYDAAAWARCMHVTAYCGEITWEEKDSDGNVFSVGPYKVWGHPMPAGLQGDWEVTRADGLKVSGNIPAPYVGFLGYEEYASEVNPFEVQEYELMRTARVAFGYAWKCEKKPKFPPRPKPEPIDVLPREPDPPWLNAHSVPAYDNVTMGWLDGAYLMTSMITDLKGVDSPFNNHGSTAALDSGTGARQLNQSARAAKASANPSQNLAKSHMDAANGNTMSMESSPAPASDGGGSVPDYNDKVDGIMNDLKNQLGDNNLTDLAGLLAELAKKYPHLQKLIMSALEALMNGSAGMLLSVCKQILSLNIDDPLIAQIKALCNSNVTDFYNTADLPGNVPSTVGNIKKGIEAMAEAQLADNEFLDNISQTDCIIDE